MLRTMAALASFGDAPAEQMSRPIRTAVDQRVPGRGHCPSAGLVRPRWPCSAKVIPQALTVAAQSHWKVVGGPQKWTACWAKSPRWIAGRAISATAIPVENNRWLSRSIRSIDQDRGERGAPLEVRVLPDGRGGGATKAVRLHPGSHPTPACRASRGAFMMPSPAFRKGSHCDGPRGYLAPTPENETERPPWRPEERASSAQKIEKTRKRGRRTGEDRCYNNGTSPGGLAGQRYLGNLGPRRLTSCDIAALPE